MTRFIPSLLMTLLMSGAHFAQASPQQPTKSAPEKMPQPAAAEPQRPERLKLMKPPSGPSFYIGPVEGSASLFSVLLADGAGSTVAGTFTAQQVNVFEAVLEEARAFALTDEKVGSTTPIITRLMDQHEWSLFVDVSKIGNKSRFYISLITPQGKLTAQAGEITRGSRGEHSALLLDALSRVKEAKLGGQVSR